MYRVLVVDDEAFITDSLAFLLENQEWTVLEVVKAYSAGEALECLNQSAFQIVISDIQMPGRSGLDLLREIHRKWPSCQVVFLSGHDDFRYAHEAMRYNAVRYVLKNEGDAVLLEAVAECIRRIERERQNTPHIPQTAEMGEITQEKRHHFLQRLVEPGREGVPAPQEWDALGISLDRNKHVMLMAGRIQESAGNGMLQAAQGILCSKIGHAVYSEAILLHEKLGLWLMQPKNNRAHTLAAIKGFAEDICGACRSSLGMHITFIFDEEEVPWETISLRVTALRDIAQNRLAENSGIALAGFRFFERQDEREDEAVFVHRVMAHIRENLGSDLSLTALSELVYLNPSYLSRRFKEMTGRNLTDTILAMRMEEACRQLEETADRVKNIAVRVGYESAAHFSRIFKREKGMTPQAYRDLFTRNL